MTPRLRYDKKYIMFYQCYTEIFKVFIAGDASDQNTEALVDVLRSRLIPGRVLAVTDGKEGILYKRHQTLARLRYRFLQIKISYSIFLLLVCLLGL